MKVTRDEARLFGRLYVLEGSRLGGKLLVKRALANADPQVRAATNYLGHGAGADFWRGFLQRLEDSAAVAAAPERTMLGAREAFGLFRAEPGRCLRPVPPPSTSPTATGSPSISWAPSSRSASWWPSTASCGRSRACRSNASDWLGVGPAELIGRPIEDVFTPESIHLIRGQLQTAVFTNTVARAFSVALLAGGSRFDIAVHVVDDSIVIECEPCVDEQGVNSGALVRAMIARLQQTSELRTFYRVAAREMRGLTGFDRVMVYRFAHDGSGEVIAESARGGLESYLGLHYPASDIPRQARILYERNWLRIIPDISATPAAVEPGLIAGRPLDLSMSVLRSVSPIHIEYLQNMGVGASMSVSILRDGKLWGLFACHHYGAAQRAVRAAHGGGTVRPDVLAPDGEPRARQRERPTRPAPASCTISSSR